MIDTILTLLPLQCILPEFRQTCLSDLSCKSQSGPRRTIKLVVKACQHDEPHKVKKEPHPAIPPALPVYLHLDAWLG